MKKGKFVECIDAEDKAFITEGERYKVIKTESIYVKIKDDIGRRGEYHKTRFKICGKK